MGNVTRTVEPKRGSPCWDTKHRWSYRIDEFLTCPEWLYLDKRCSRCGEGRQVCLRRAL